jgi:2Fe-2S type ferredoxin
MPEPIHFHTDLYRRDALELAAAKYQDRARVELADSGTQVAVRLEPLTRDQDSRALFDEFCNEVFYATARKLRDLGAGDSRKHEHRDPSGNEPPWSLLAPFREGDPLGLGWVLDSLSPVRGGSATMVLRHQQHGVARVAIRRNSGAPLGVAHTDHLDFMLMNGGGGSAQTEASIGRVLIRMAQELRGRNDARPDGELLAVLLPHAEAQAPQRPANGNGAARAAASYKRLAPEVDLGQGTISFEIDETGISRLALYDAVLAFADRCYVFLTRRDETGIGLQLKPREELSADLLKPLVRDLTKALNQLVREKVAGSPAGSLERNAGLPRLPRQSVDLDALIAELDAADPATLGLGFQPDRGPGHENLRVLNILGTGACNSDCVFCCEKFNPGNRLMPSADATRQLILDSAGQFDMLFFASGEPTIHPKLFQHVELARSVGFTCFGMSSHFRTFADPRFALKALQAGFEYFDISLHAADPMSQLDVNPIGDGGQSLFEALKGLAIIFRLADALGIRVSVTQKIVVSRLNVTQLESIFRAGYDRGVRHFILQPARTLGLSRERQTMLAISEEEILPHLNELLRKTEGLGAVLKPYGFSRQNLLVGSHVEHEQNRVKNIMGKAKTPRGQLMLPKIRERKPSDGRFWVEVRTSFDDEFGFAADGRAPILDEALQRGADLPFGCRMGSCGMCCARLLEGQVDQSSQIFLSEEQERQGFVLLCQARPLSDVTVVMCTDDEIDPL